MSLSAQPETVPAWTQIRTELRQRVSESTFEIWLAALEARSLDGGVLTVQAPPATRQWVSARYAGLLERCSRDVLGPGVKVAFTDAQTRRRPGAGPGSAPSLAAGPRCTFNPRYSFEQFIIGESNQLAHAAALAVAELPGQAYNPLFLYAPPGLGKTHLLHAIGNYALAFGAGASVRYTTAEDFTNHFMAALSTRSVEPFKRAYRDADVLLIDDVQFLAGKARTEEEFFHTFNALYETGRQLVITCDQVPAKLTRVAARLRERFAAGLVAELGPPDLATRLAILRKRAALDGIQLADPQVLELLAERVSTNIRALEGALIRLVAHNSLTQRPIDLALATELLDLLYPRGGGEPPTIARVQAVVGAHYSVTHEELVSPARAVRVTWPRQVAIHLARELTDESLQAIGAAFGGRNHGTVLHACKRVAARLSDDHNFGPELSSLAERIRH